MSNIVRMTYSLDNANDGRKHKNKFVPVPIEKETKKLFITKQGVRIKKSDIGVVQVISTNAKAWLEIIDIDKSDDELALMIGEWFSKNAHEAKTP